MTKLSKNNPYLTPLEASILPEKDLEKKLDFLRVFKKQIYLELTESVKTDQWQLEPTMEALSDLADALLITSYQIAKNQLRKNFGLPRYKDNDGNFLSGEFAIVGMGKIGAQEVHFGSDLDLIFIFNRNGETFGAKAISNKEYFAKITQRIINYLTLYTRHGYLYKVDTELRPSGQAGTLVTPLDPWISYYHEKAAIWEKQALLKARLIYASGDFADAFTGLFRRLIFLSPFPEDFGEEILHLRGRIEKELAKETSDKWHFKKGKGGMVDIEFTLQYLQLKLGKIYEDILFRGTLPSLAAIESRGIMAKEDCRFLESAYRFYRKLEFKMEVNEIPNEGYINKTEENASNLAELMGFKKRNDFLREFGNYRDHVRDIFLKTVKTDPSS